MPYMKVTEGGKVRVFKKGPDGKPMGKMMGEHDSEEAANTQIAAIEANEDKETKEGDHTKCYDSFGVEMDVMYVPLNVISFSELEALEEAEDSAKEARKLTSYFSQLAYNITGSMDINDKAAALSRLAGGVSFSFS